ncbi:unnamed protein product, partial [Linum tenue]
KSAAPRWSSVTWPVTLWQTTPDHLQQSPVAQDSSQSEESTKPFLRSKRARLSVGWQASTRLP